MLKRLISSFFTRGGIAMLNLGILLLASRQLGSGIVGQMSQLILNIAVVQIMNEIYTGYALVHYVPRLGVWPLYRTGILWSFGSTILINLLFLLLSQFGIGAPELWLHGMILSLAITLHSFHCVLLLGREKIAAYNLLMLLQPLLTFSTLALQIFVLSDKTADSYITALYVSYCSCAVLSLIIVAATLKSRPAPATGFSLKPILRSGFVNQLGNLAHTLSNRFNYYMIGTYALIGVYASATSLIESVWIIGGSVAPVILSHVANTNDAQNNARLSFLLSKLSFLLSLICVLIIMFLPEEFFTALLGKDFTHTKSVMLHLSPGVLCISFSTVISHYFSGIGQQKVQLTANSLGLVVTLGSSYFLISRFGLTGACYAASMSYFTAALVLTIVFMKENKFRSTDLFRLRNDLKLLKR